MLPQFLPALLPLFVVKKRFPFLPRHRVTTDRKAVIQCNLAPLSDAPAVAQRFVPAPDPGRDRPFDDGKGLPFAVYIPAELWSEINGCILQFALQPPIEWPRCFALLRVPQQPIDGAVDSGVGVVLVPFEEFLIQ